MNIKEQEQHIELFFKKQLEVMIKKGNDYSSEDRLSSFKLAGAISQLSPERTCLSLISTKVARIGILLNGKLEENESLKDSILDLANYCILLDQIIEDRNRT